MIASRADGFLTTPEAARLVGVQPVTIRKWRMLGRIVAQGRDEKGYPLYTPQAVRSAEREVRENGIAASGIDPRRLRKSARSSATPRDPVTEMAGIETTGHTGPGVAYLGHIGIEWPAPAQDGMSLVLPGWKIAVWDALSGRPVTTVTRIELHASAVDVIAADVTMFADLDGRPVYTGQPYQRDGETIWGTFPFLVAWMRVAQPAPERGTLEPRFIEPCAS